MELRSDFEYRDVAVFQYEECSEPFSFHFARSVFDWGSCHRQMVERCKAQKAEAYYVDGPTAVYVIKVDGAPYCKIGISNTPLIRVKEIQTSHWSDVSIHAVLWVWDGRARDVEALSHRAAFGRNIDLKGEWVRMEPDDAFHLVLETAARLKVEASDGKGVFLTREDECKSRAHALKTQKRLSAQTHAKRLGY